MITIKTSIPGGAFGAFGTDPQIDVTGNYNGGTLIDGQRYVIAPAGVVVSGSTPAPGTVDGRAGHGMMKNLAQHPSNLDPAQALDAGGSQYDAGQALDLNEVHRPGDCIVKVKSSDPRDNAGREGLFAGETVLHVVASAPAAGAIAPIIWPSDDLANRPWREADLDGFLSSLPTLASSGAPDWADLAQWWDRIYIGLPWNRTFQYQYMSPQFYNAKNSAYGEYNSIFEGVIWAGLCGNEWSTADKTAAAIRMLSNGCQLAETYGAFGLQLVEDGAHYQFGQAGALAWLRWTSQLARYDEISALIGANVRNQYYEVTAGLFDPHTDPLKPFIARERTVNAITGSGPYEVDVTDYRTANTTEDGDTIGEFIDLNLIRKSNGATALITAQWGQGQSPGLGWKFTVSSLPTGLTVGDTIYTGEVSPMPVGTIDWMIRSQIPSFKNPAPDARYRKQWRGGNTLMALSAAGMRGADYDNAVAYLLRQTAAQAYGTLHEEVLGAPSTFGQTFWSTHQATVLALPQVV